MPDLAKKCKICDNFMKEIVLFLEGGPGGVRDEVREGLGERQGGFRECSRATDQPACAKTCFFSLIILVFSRKMLQNNWF